MTHAEQMSFGQWLRQRRKKRARTQENLADLIDCSPETVRKIEVGRRRPSRQMVEVLAQPLGVGQEELPALLQLARSGPGVEDAALPGMTRSPDGNGLAEPAPKQPPARPTNLLAWRTTFIGR